jgi:hypothetical protein
MLLKARLPGPNQKDQICPLVVLKWPNLGRKFNKLFLKKLRSS